jgi:hypothetical protein
MKEAFSGEGLIAFNDLRLQNNKTPVYKIKLWYSKKETEESGLQQLYSNMPKQSVLTGDNYMFVVMEKNGKRVFDIAPLYDSVKFAKELIKTKPIDIEESKRLMCGKILVENKNKPDRVLFYLQQNDLVYMPNAKDDILELDAEKLKEWFKNNENKKSFAQRVYKVVKFSGKDCFFIPNNYAKEISLSKDLSETELSALKNKYVDKKIPRQELNYEEFSSFGNCVKCVPDERFIRNIIEKKIQSLLKSKISVLK